MKYDIEKLRQVLEQKYLIPAKRTGYVCPICNNGTGKDGTGIVSKDGIHFTCFKGCFSNADIIDIVAIAENIPEETKIKDLMRIYGIDKSQDYMTKKQIRIERHQEEPKTDIKELELLNKSLENKSQAIEFLNTYRKINKEYLETLNNIGYYKDTTNKFNNEYLTIKTSDASFIRRNADTKSNFRFKNYGSNKPSKLELLKIAEPVIVVESYIDLMSIESIGYKAICLNSTANYTAFIEYIEKNKKDIQASIILCLDNDDTGEDTNELIRRELEKTNITFMIGTESILSYTGDKYIKDANDLLKVNTEILKEFIKRESAFLKWLNNKKRKSVYDKEHLKYWKRTLKNAKQELKELENGNKEED